MNTESPQSRCSRAFAAVIGPSQVADLARTVPRLETDELVRILLSAGPDFEKRSA
jgi:hypothetical protein